MPRPTTAAEVEAFRRFAHALAADPNPPASLEECLRRFRDHGGSDGTTPHSPTDPPEPSGKTLLDAPADVVGVLDDGPDRAEGIESP